MPEKYTKLQFQEEKGQAGADKLLFIPLYSWERVSQASACLADLILDLR